MAPFPQLARAVSSRGALKQAVHRLAVGQHACGVGLECCDREVVHEKATVAAKQASGAVTLVVDHFVMENGVVHHEAA